MDIALVNESLRPLGPTKSIARLSKLLDGKAILEEPMAAHTSLHVGGPAEAYVVASSAKELVEYALLARKLHLPLFVLGGGSNILVSDSGIKGLVIHNQGQSFGTEFVSGIGEGNEALICIIRADSGVLLSHLANYCSRLGLAGLEWAIGIPGTLGGALVNNAGAFGSDISQVVRQVRLLDANGKIVTIEPSEAGFGYRASRLGAMSREGAVLLEATLHLQRAAVAEIQERVNRFRDERTASQPRKPSAGSVFRNPPGDYAGRLIEQAGLKGERIGGAQVSEKHANFIVNVGHARAQDIYDLITLAKERVQERFGVQLELEIQLVGDWPSSHPGNKELSNRG